MIALKSLLLHLSDPDVTEVTLASERSPSARRDGAVEPLSADVLSTDDILQALFNAGGSRHVDALSPKPTQWSTRVDGVGPVAVSAVMHGEFVQARFTRRERETQNPAPPRAPTPPPPEVVEIAFEIDAESRRPMVPPPSQAPRVVTAREVKGSVAIGRVTPLLPGEPRGTPIGRVSPSQPAPDRLFKDLLAVARQRGASDLHLVAGRPPILRVAGKLSPEGEVLDPRRADEVILARVPARLTQALARDGSVDFSLEEPGVGRCRVNVGRQRTGLKACIRLIPAQIPTLASLGLPEAIGAAARHHQGLIVITGPTGHGKTTTMASIVDILNRETTHHIITIEDPVELVHPRKKAMMSQREVGTHTRSFAAALKAALREDPDVIVVGELRDTETVRMALSASETGHLVLGTMNTPSAAKTIDRLIDLFPPADQPQVRVTLAGGLRLIVSQRLVPSPDGLHLVAAAEVLPGSVPLWSLIRDGKTYQIPSLQQRGKGLGVIRLDASLADLVRAGKTTIEAAMAVAEQSDDLAAALGAPVEASPDRLSEPFGEPAAQPAPAATGAKGLLERASALFGKRGG